MVTDGVQAIPPKTQLSAISDCNVMSAPGPCASSKNVPEGDSIIQARISLITREGSTPLSRSLKPMVVVHEFLVVQTEQMHNGGVEIVDTYPAFDGVGIRIHQWRRKRSRP